MAKRITKALLQEQLQDAKTEIEEQAIKLKDWEAGKLPETPEPFKIPDDIEDPYSKLIYCLSDLAGHIVRLEEAERTGGSGDYAYTFTSVFDMIDQVRPLLHERGLYMSGSMLIESENYTRHKFTTSTQREGVEALIPIEWTIENYFGASKSVVILGEAKDTSDKATGKAFTASQKTALRSLTGLSTGDPEDSEADSYEAVAASAPAGAQAKGSAESYGTKIAEVLGVCPIHDEPFRPPTKKAEAAGHGASHKDGDGWCQYGDVRQGYEAEVGPMIKAKLGDVATWVEWLAINAEAARLTYIAAIPKKLGMYRPQDWHFIRKALEALPDIQQELAPEDGPAESAFCDLPVGNPEAGKTCKLAANHPEYIEHNAAPTLAEIENAREATEVQAEDEIEPEDEVEPEESTEDV